MPFRVFSFSSPHILPSPLPAPPPVTLQQGAFPWSPAPSSVRFFGAPCPRQVSFLRSTAMAAPPARGCPPAGPVLARLGAAPQWPCPAHLPPSFLLFSLPGVGTRGHWLSSHSVPGTAAGSYGPRAPGPVRSLESKLCLTNKETEAQRSQVTCPRPHSKRAVESEPTPRSV